MRIALYYNKCEQERAQYESYVIATDSLSRFTTDCIHFNRKLCRSSQELLWLENVRFYDRFMQKSMANPRVCIFLRRRTLKHCCKRAEEEREGEDPAIHLFSHTFINPPSSTHTRMHSSKFPAHMPINSAESLPVLCFGIKGFGLKHFGFSWIFPLELHF